MHLTGTVAALLSCTVVQALSNSSPVVLFSTSKLPTVSPSDQVQLQTSSAVESSLKQLLVSCPTQRYFLVSQPNLHASDIRNTQGNCQATNLCQAIGSEKYSGTYHVAEVVGQITSDSLVDYVKDACSARGKTADVQLVEMKHLSSLSEPERRARLQFENDRELGLLLDSLTDNYTVLLFSDPNESKSYEADFGEAVHMDLKRRDLLEVVDKRKNNSTSLLLFEKYQFFTPGIFMTLIIVVILFSILGVGLNALSSLKVPYGSFDKEMGPAAQKK